MLLSVLLVLTAGVSVVSSSVVNFPPGATSGSPIQDAITWAQANHVDPAAVLSIIAFEGGPGTNQNCGGGATCSGYFQLNNTLYAGQYIPGNVFSELAVPGVGDRIAATFQRYQQNWQSLFPQFWVDAQGGNPAGVPPSQFQAAIQQGVAWAGGAPFQAGTTPGPGIAGQTVQGNLSDYFSQALGGTTPAYGTTTLNLPGNAAQGALGAIPGGAAVGAITGFFGAALKKLTGKALSGLQLSQLGQQLGDTAARTGIFVVGLVVIGTGAAVIALRREAAPSVPATPTKGEAEEAAVVAA